jgi:hypothetical protein
MLLSRYEFLSRDVTSVGDNRMRAKLIEFNYSNARYDFDLSLEIIRPLISATFVAINGGRK